MAFYRRFVLSLIHRLGRKKPALPLATVQMAIMVGVDDVSATNHTSRATAADAIAAANVSPRQTSTVRAGGAPALAGLMLTASAFAPGSRYPTDLELDCSAATIVRAAHGPDDSICCSVAAASGDRGK